MLKHSRSVWLGAVATAVVAVVESERAYCAGLGGLGRGPRGLCCTFVLMKILAKGYIRASRSIFQVNLMLGRTMTG